MKLKITVDGKAYEVEVEVSEPEPLQPAYVPPSAQTRVPAAAAPGAPPTARPVGTPQKAADESKVCRSPFAGTVSRVAVQVGQTIQVNDVLMILEAMKMETVITAPIAGKVAVITVAPGDAVQQGQILVEFE
ncbi:MAG TPA: biotin/lipoyl-containing protein [Isosphaeraceae bacterium]